MNEHIASLSTYALLPTLVDACCLRHADANSVLCVLDTNVLLDIHYWKDPDVQPLSAELNQTTLRAVFSQETLEELLDILARPQFKLSNAEQEQLLRAILKGALFLDAPLKPCGVRCQDDDDQKFLDLAVQVKAKWLFSKDKRVLKTAKRLAKFGVCVERPSRTSPRGSCPNP